MALPAIDALTDRFSRARIMLFVGQHSQAVFGDHAGIDVLRHCPERFDAWSATLFGLKALARESFDLAILLDRSRWLRLSASFARIPRVLHATGRTPETRHEATVYFDVARQAGVDAPMGHPVLRIGKGNTGTLPTVSDVAAPYAVIHPGGGQNPGTTMEEKRWPPARFAALAQWLHRQGIGVVFTGSAAERQLALTIARQAGLSEDTVIAGRYGLAQTATIIRDAVLYVGGDTGVSHIAAAVGAPTIAIFGPTNPLRYQPLGIRVRVIAPPASWELPEIDLRKQAQIPSAAMISNVEFDQVMAACRELLTDTASC
jgi:heptosyltransferase II